MKEREEIERESRMMAAGSYEPYSFPGALGPPPGRRGSRVNLPAGERSPEAPKIQPT